MQLTVTCSSTKLAECIVAFPMRQWLPERVKMLRRITSLILFIMPTEYLCISCDILNQQWLFP
jgi:hypothetical protein